MGILLPSDKQVLITGCYRSGTEYITLLLNNHPNLAAIMYVVGFMRFCYDRYNPVQDRSNYTRLLTDAAERISVRWNRVLNVHEILDRCDEEGEVTYGLLYDLMMRSLYVNEKLTAWAEKTQLVWREIPAFLDMFPQGKVIHIIRDPRAVLASFKKFTYAPEPLYLGAVFNCYDSMHFGLDYQQRFGPDRYILVKYEQFVESSESAIIKLFKFLGLSYDHDLLSKDGWTDPLGQPWRHNSVYLSAEATTSEINTQVFKSQWIDQLSPEELALTQEIIGGLMDDYQYERIDVHVPWPEMIRPLLSDDTLTGYLQTWATKQQGIQANPTDPILPENWVENVVSRKMAN